MTTNTTQSYIIWFEDIGTEALTLAGGKRANLGKLVQIGLPVPPGFVSRTTTYNAFLEANDLQDNIVELASQPNATDPQSFETAAEEIRQLFEQAMVPDDVVDAIQDAHSQLAGDGEMVVVARSLATVEDLPGASFAGQQETFLNLRNSEELFEAVKQCWAMFIVAVLVTITVHEILSHRFQIWNLPYEYES